MILLILCIKTVMPDTVFSQLYRHHQFHSIGKCNTTNKLSAPKADSMANLILKIL